MGDKDELRGLVAAVTGGGSGLGAAMATLFARAGMSVAVLDIDAANAEAVAGALAEEHGVATLGLGVDVGDSSSITAAAEAVADSLGGCDVVCANVGVQQFGAIDRLTEDDWQWVLDINVMGVVRTVGAFLPLLRRRDGFRRIVLTASSGALVPGVRLAAYTASKAAVIAYGETLRLELADEGIGVTILVPAGMQTRHLESSKLARPSEIGEWTIAPDDIDAMMASRSIGDEHVATADHAVRNLLADLVADEPYVITHGEYRAAYHDRLAAIEAAFDRMERS
jgi:NAD(P)-dependent dehydrogenase (short-subunit alcohol dehydrogenase family)